MLTVRHFTLVASIAALYVVLTVNPIFIGLSFGPIQFRISEILTILPFFTPYAIPGLFLGTLMANLFSTHGLIDVIFGSLATLFAAWITSKMPNRWLAPLPPVIVNAIVIGSVIGFISNSMQQIPLFMLYVGLSQLVVCYGLGMPFLFLLEKYRSVLFSNKK